jgi:hypothetical protein
MFSKVLRRKTSKPSSAPLVHLLTSNSPPSNVEEILARNTIQALRDSLTVLQLEIDNYLSDPRTAATDLEGHKAAIIKSISAHESIISPLRKLPPELLQVIFQKTYWDLVTTFNLPWSLSQVCQSWRIIVHATPILWSCITIVFHTKPTSLRSQEARLRFILQRSLNVDLRVSIRGNLGYLEDDKRLSLLLILMAHSERWGYLSLDFTLVESTIYLQAVKNHLPKLSQLHLKFGIPEGLAMTVDMFSIAPRLETVIIGHVHNLRSIRVIVPLPLQQLSSYVRTVPGESITSLAAFSHLVHLETVWERTVDPLEPRITFPRLKVLVIFFSHSNRNSANGFFERLILPCISEIIVQGQADGVTFPLSSMISRSLPCNLCTLSITATTPENPSDLTSLLLLTPRLKDLRIHLSSYLDPFAALKSPAFLPKLQSLCIVVPQFFPPSLSSALATFIATRVESHTKEESRLRNLQLRFVTEFTCRTAYFAMQPSPQVGELDSDMLALINSWKKRLLEDIPHLSRHPIPQKMFINKLMHWRRLDQLFTTIEGYDIPTSGYLHVRVFSMQRTMHANLCETFKGLEITFCDVRD